MRVCSYGQPKGAGQPEVGQLQVVVPLVDEQVLGLQVPVQHPAGPCSRLLRRKSEDAPVPASLTHALA